MTVAPVHRLTIAKPPSKADLLKLIDDLRADIESGKIISLVAIPIYTDMEFGAFSAGNISMLELAGLLGRAWADAIEELKA